MKRKYHPFGIKPIILIPSICNPFINTLFHQMFYSLSSKSLIDISIHMKKLYMSVCQSVRLSVLWKFLPCLAAEAEDLSNSPFLGMRVFNNRMAWSSHTQACIFLHR